MREHFIEPRSLLARVERLERENRRLKLVGLGVALCITVLLLMAVDKTPKTIEAEMIVVRDSHGRARITIGTPAFAGVTIGAYNPDDPGIWMTDAKGADRAMLVTDGLFFANGKAKPTVSLSSAPDGTSGLKFYGTNGKALWTAP